MSALPWFKCYPRDFLDGMVSLTPEERGAYFTLVCLMYARGGPVPDEPRWLAGQLLVSVRGWSKLRAALIVKGKLYVAECGGLANERAVSELERSAKPPRKPDETAAKVRDKTRENGAELNDFKDIAAAAGLMSAREKQPLDTDTDTDTEKNTSHEVEVPSEPVLAHSRKRERSKPKELPKDFVAFWDAYPRKVGKLKAVEAYAKARRGAEADEIMAGLAEACRQPKWRDEPEFIPHPATWLNQGRWMDEAEVKISSAALKPVVVFVDGD